MDGHPSGAVEDPEVNRLLNRSWSGGGAGEEMVDRVLGISSADFALACDVRRQP